MARRPARAPDEMPNEPTSVVTSPPQPIAFRDFDPDRVDEEFVRAEVQVQTALEHYESAKTVSQRVLDARVCL